MLEGRDRLPTTPRTVDPQKPEPQRSGKPINQEYEEDKTVHSKYGTGPRWRPHLKQEESAMFVKVGSQIVELFKEEPKAESDHGMMIAFGILMFSIGIIAAILASL